MGFRVEGLGVIGFRVYRVWGWMNSPKPWVFGVSR